MTQTTQLLEKTPEERLRVYNYITQACTHLYSKGKLQVNSFNDLKVPFATLAKEDPLFLAHLTAWAAKKDSKDLKLLAVYFNFLSDANGMPFFDGATSNKPNFRLVSSALYQTLPPNLALRVVELAKYKFEVPNMLAMGAHFPQVLENAARNYIIYRENNVQMIEGIRKNGLGPQFVQMYRMLHMTPTRESAAILGWKQKGRDIQKRTISFEGMNAEQIAAYIVGNKLSPLVAIPLLGDKQMTAVVAEALMTVSTGNQAVVLQNMFRSRGFLEIPEINQLFISKVQTATTTVDRIDTLSKDLNEEEKAVLSQVRSQVRKEKTGDLGKIFMHIDISGSMDRAIDYAKDAGATFAECVQNPGQNFNWGLFNTRAEVLKKPEKFTKEGFYGALYGRRASGGTNCLALYEAARQFGANVDVYITDEDDTMGNMEHRLRTDLIPKFGKPNAAVIVRFGNSSRLTAALEANGIPVTVMKPETLKSSALIADAVATAVKGQLAVIEDIMNTSLPKLPHWYGDRALRESYKARI